VRIILLYTLLVICSGLSGQILLERSVLSSFSMNGIAGGLEIFSTLGQVSWETTGGPPFYLTQGFEQPLDKAPLSFDVESYFDRCSGTYIVHLTDFSGCVTAENVIIAWEGIVGDTSFVTSSPNVSVAVSGAVGCYGEFTLDLSGSAVTSLDCGLVFYSYISPNEDGRNDTWIIEHLNSPRFGSNEVTILNRWGQVVWKKSDYDNSTVVWKGDSDSGDLLPDGTYFYLVRIGDQTYNGFVELQR
jgi:gliding motility-associated-like protein